VFGLAWMAWDEVRSHPLRTLLTLLSVAIGVGAVVAIQCASSSARRAFAELHESLTGKADLEIVAADGSRFDAASAAEASRTDGVGQVIPVLRRPTILYANGKRVATSALGVDETTAQAVSQFALSAGRFWNSHPEAPDACGGEPGNSAAARLEVLLESQLAQNLGLQVGDPATFLMPRGPTRTVVVGFLSLRSAVSLAEHENVFFRLSDLQRAARLEGKIDQLRIQLAEGQSRDKVQRRLQAVLPAVLAVRVPLTQTDLADATLRAADQGLKFAQAVALLMALFIIINTFLISVTQRYRQWGLLRAVGATQSQVLRLLVAEALAIGVAGSLLGLATGLASARVLASVMARTLDAQAHGVELNPGLTIFVLFLGPALAVLGCYVPARRACLASPIDAVRGDIPSSATRVPWLLVVLAGLVWFSSFLVLAGCAAERLPAWLAIPAGLGMMLGFVLMVPPVLPTVARFVTSVLLSRLWPVEGQMAQDQVFGNRLRTALTTAVVVVALANTIGLGHELLNSVDDVRDWYRRSMFADLILIPTTSEGAVEFGLRAKDRPEPHIRQVDGVTAVQTVRFVQVRANDRPALLISRGFPADGESPWRLTGATWPAVRAQLAQGQIVIGGMLAKLCDAGVGRTLRVEYGGRVRALTVAAVVTDYHYGGLSLYIEREFARHHLGVDGVDAFLVSLDAGRRTAATDALRSLAQRLRLNIHSFDDLRAWLDGVMNGVMAAFWAILGLGLVVAAVGIFNTITMNVLEQTREIGLLRIVGMTRGQVLRTVIAQGLILALLGILLGTTAGLATAYLMHLCKGPILGGYTAFYWRPGLVVLADSAALALVVAASYSPARQAARLDALESVQEE
jgi:putative ABC transport system permease protein